jgi:hypothetical protein
MNPYKQFSDETAFGFTLEHMARRVEGATLSV